MERRKRSQEKKKELKHIYNSRYRQKQELARERKLQSNRPDAIRKREQRKKEKNVERQRLENRIENVYTEKST